MVETFSLDKKFIKILLYRLTVGVASSDADGFLKQRRRFPPSNADGFFGNRSKTEKRFS